MANKYLEKISSLVAKLTRVGGTSQFRVPGGQMSAIKRVQGLADDAVKRVKGKSTFKSRMVSPGSTTFTRVTNKTGKPGDEQVRARIYTNK
jgi:hypothetical protein